MKTLLVFASKYGGTRVVVQKAAEHIGDCRVWELGKESLPDIKQFDCIVVGSPLYAGQIHGDVKEFVKTHRADLLDKKLGIFLAGLDTSDGEHYFQKNFPAPLLEHAAAKGMFGGICDPGTLGPFTRILMRLITRKRTYSSTVSEEKIKAFAGALKK